MTNKQRRYDHSANVVSLDPVTVSPQCVEETGYWHTHGNYSDEHGNLTKEEKGPYDSNNFSPQDKKVARMMSEGKDEYKEYVGTPSEVFTQYNGGTELPISYEMACFDRND